MATQDFAVQTSKIFKNTNFVKRDYKTTNLVYAVAEVAPGEEWVETNEFDGFGEEDIELLSGTRQLYKQNGVRYFGYL